MAALASATAASNVRAPVGAEQSHRPVGRAGPDAPDRAEGLGEGASEALSPTAGRFSLEIELDGQAVSFSFPEEAAARWQEIQALPPAEQEEAFWAWVDLSACELDGVPLPHLVEDDGEQATVDFEDRRYRLSAEALELLLQFKQGAIDGQLEVERIASFLEDVGERILTRVDGIAHDIVHAPKECFQRDGDAGEVLRVCGVEVHPIHFAAADEVLQEILDLEGAGELKETAQDLYAYAQQRRRKALDQILLDDVVALTGMLSGDKGTGKTSGLKLLGRLCTALGLTPRGVEVLSAGLLPTDHQGAAQFLKAAEGKFLVIDEAHQIPDSDTVNFIKQWVAYAEENRGRLALWFALYQKQRRQFLHCDEGMERRLLFKELYARTPELPEIARALEKMANKLGFELDDDARLMLRRLLRVKRLDPSFENYGEIKNLLAKALLSVARRDPGSDLVTGADIGREWLALQSKREVRDAIAAMAEQHELHDWLDEVESLVEVAHRNERSANGALPQLMVVTGELGTPVQKVAEALIPGVYHELGLRYSTKVEVVANLGGLTGAVVGKAQENLKERFEEAEGKILVIHDPLTALETNAFGADLVEAMAGLLTDFPCLLVFTGTRERLEQLLAHPKAAKLAALLEDQGGADLAQLALGGLDLSSAAQTLDRELAAQGLSWTVASAEVAPEVLAHLVDSAGFRHHASVSKLAEAIARLAERRDTTTVTSDLLLEAVLRTSREDGGFGPSPALLKAAGTERLAEAGVAPDSEVGQLFSTLFGQAAASQEWARVASRPKNLPKLLEELVKVAALDAPAGELREGLRRVFTAAFPDVAFELPRTLEEEVAYLRGRVHALEAEVDEVKRGPPAPAQEGDASQPVEYWI